MRCLGIAAAVWAAAACATAAQDASGQAPTGPLHLVGGTDEVSDWTTDPVEVQPGVWRVWWWKLFHPAPFSDGMDRAASGYEVHCAAGELRQVRQELYVGDRLMRGWDQTQPLHHPVGAWADPQVMARVCGGQRPTVSVADVDAAVSHFRRR